jgi:hypothetical protein
VKIALYLGARQYLRSTGGDLLDSSLAGAIVADAAARIRMSRIIPLMRARLERLATGPDPALAVATAVRVAMSLDSGVFLRASNASEEAIRT